MVAEPVLVVGAGPTGLVLALWLTRSGVPVRIIDREAEPGTTSRALVVQARTLEFYRQLGLADDVIARGIPFATVNLWSYGKRIGHAEFGAIGAGVTPYPYICIFPQDEHERLLIEHLRRAGVDVERKTELIGFTEHDDGVTASIRRADGSTATREACYLAGCDGARSRVREVLGIEFPGGTYERVFYVADALVHGPVANHELHVALDDADFFAAFPLKGEGAVRLIGTVRPESEYQAERLTWNDVSRRAVEHLGVTADRINWFSTYHVHHRVASRFRSGRAFLVGDAAHIHSPVGGQGMNTGIGDAVNLAWKLAAAVKNPAAAGMLDSYEPERMAFARRLVASTDRAFTFVTRNGVIARFVRRRAFPLLFPWLAARAAVRRYMFRAISQTAINYRGSALSEGRAGRVNGGDRLPWVRLEGGASTDNFTPLASRDWQVHVYGDPTVELAKACTARAVELHQFPWRDATGLAGLQRNGAYLVRPDGYVAVAGLGAARLPAYLDQRGIR